MPLPAGTEQIGQAISAIDRLDRREFLKALGAAVGVAGLTASGFVPGTAEAAMPEGIRFMGPDEYKVFVRIMEVSLPVEGTSLVPPTQIPVMQTLDAALLGMMAPYELAGLKAGIAAFEEGPVKAHGKPFSQLGDPEAAAFCDAWAASKEPDQRGLVTALKKLVALSYWANPPSWAPLGYDGPVSEKWGLKPLGPAPMPSE